MAKIHVKYYEMNLNNIELTTSKNPILNWKTVNKDTQKKRTTMTVSDVLEK